MNKYRAKKTTVFGITFDSKLEANRYMVLKSAEQEGIISDLKTQHPVIELLPKFKTDDGKTWRPLKYIPDFSYTLRETGKRVIEDTKGIETPIFKLKLKMMAYLRPEIYADFKTVKQCGEDLG
jgi:hypothetical protein